MSLDDVNYVAFGYGEDPSDTHVVSVPLHAGSGIRQAWQEVVAEHGLRAEQVVAIMSEWSATPADERFLSATFPDTEVEYAFGRPDDPDDWPAALATRREVMERAAARQALTEPATGEPETLPVLRTYEPTLAAGLELVPDALYVGFTDSTPTGGGPIRSRHLGSGDLTQRYGGMLPALERTGTSLRSGLRVAVVEPAGRRRDALYTLRREAGYRAAAALGVPGFGAAMCAWLDTPRLVVGLCCNDTLVFTAAGGPHQSAVGDRVRGHEHRDDLVTPSVFAADGDELTLLDRVPGED